MLFRYPHGYNHLVITQKQTGLFPKFLFAGGKKMREQNIVGKSAVSDDEKNPDYKNVEKLT